MPEVSYVVTTAGSFDLLAEVVCEDDDQLLDLLSRRIRTLPGRQLHRDVRLSQTQQTELRLGYPMTTEPTPVYEPSSDLPHAHGRAVLRGRPRPPVDALHPPLDVRGPHRRRRGPHRADHHPRRGRLHLGRPRQEVPRRPRRAVRRPGRPRPRGAGRGGRPPGPRAGVLPALVLRPPQGDRAGRAARVRTPPATSTASSSPPAAARPSRAPGSWPSSTTSWSASPPSTR